MKITSQGHALSESEATTPPYHRSPSYAQFQNSGGFKNLGKGLGWVVRACLSLLGASFFALLFALSPGEEPNNGRTTRAVIIP